MHRSAHGSPQHREGRSWLLAAALFVGALLASGCVAAADVSEEPADAATTSSSTAVPRTTGIPTMRPTSAESLGIVLDPSGRPWDNYWGPEDATTETRYLTKVHIPAGRLEVVSGDDIVAWSGLTLRDTESVDLRGTEDFDLLIVWERRPDDEGAVRESVLGVQLLQPGTVVDRWGGFETAYRTTAGFGGFFSRPVLGWARDNVDLAQSLVDREPTSDRPFALADLDGEPGRDTFVFRNGSGAGRFEMSRAFDVDGRVIGVMIWHPRYPWRLAVPVGEPPPDVTEREDELIDCIEGRRLIDKWGRCT